METMSLAPGMRFLPRLFGTMRGTLAASKKSFRRFDCSSTALGGTPITWMDPPTSTPIEIPIEC